MRHAIPWPVANWRARREGDIPASLWTLRAVGGDIKLATLIVLGSAPDRASALLVRAGGDPRLALSELALDDRRC